MALQITRRITFCAGHRLLGHEGRCANLHGHNYAAEITVEAEDGGVDEIGRVVDFKVLKQTIGAWIDTHWDHAFVLWDKDVQALEALQQVEPHRLYVMDVSPTAENMADHLLRVACPEALKGTGVRAVKIVLWETEEACAIAAL